MYVQEYGSESPKPNTRCVYIAYFDSNRLFNPKEHSRAVFHEILLSYMDYVKDLGYATVHIWCCPPKLYDYYIFLRDDKQPISKKSLHEWYTEMLRKGIDAKIIHEQHYLADHFPKDHDFSIDRLPYFEGDFWPKTIEEAINRRNRDVRLLIFLLTDRSS